MKIRIKQSWTKIDIVMESESSKSYSYSASIITDTSQDTFITYTYSNDPEPDADTNMEKHRGTAQLTVNNTDECQVLKGGYYTGRGRDTHGKMYLRKTK